MQKSLHSNVCAVSILFFVFVSLVLGSAKVQYLYPSDDSYVNNNSPGTNYDSSSPSAYYIMVGDYQDESKIARGYIKFDISTIFIGGWPRMRPNPIKRFDMKKFLDEGEMKKFLIEKMKHDM